MKRTVMVGVLCGSAMMAAGCKAPVATETATVTNTEPVQAVPGMYSERSESASEARGLRRGPRAQKGGAPGVFDFYLLTLSWSPEYCVTHQSAAECAAHPAFELHGLWPENSDGTYPENCSDAAGPANPGQYKDIYPDQSLLAHEWATHGTCSGLTPDAYFQAERKAFDAVKVPSQLGSLKTAVSMTPGAILADFSAANPTDKAGEVVLACGNNRLTAIEVCLSKSLTAVSCGSVKTCRANSVKITPPGATSDQ
jgi:ribonuclease T2